MTVELIEMVDGIPHVRNEMVLDDKPIKVIRLWPLQAASGKVEGGERCEYRGDGFYLVVTKMWGARNFRLPDGGATEAVMREEQVDPPRTKLETRWNGGRWEKLTRRGWVTA